MNRETSPTKSVGETKGQKVRIHEHLSQKTRRPCLGDEGTRQENGITCDKCGAAVTFDSQYVGPSNS